MFNNNDKTQEFEVGVFWTKTSKAGKTYQSFAIDVEALLNYASSHDNNGKIYGFINKSFFGKNNPKAPSHRLVIPFNDEDKAKIEEYETQIEGTDDLDDDDLGDL